MDAKTAETVASFEDILGTKAVSQVSSPKGMAAARAGACPSNKD